MTAVIGALAPIFGLIVLGYAMRQGRFVPLEFWPAAEKVTYYVFFPALLVHSLGTAALDLEDYTNRAISRARGIRRHTIEEDEFLAERAQDELDARIDQAAAGR